MKYKPVQVAIALAILVIASLGSQANAGRYYRAIRYRMDKSFNATERGIIRQAVNLVANRFLDPQMFRYADAHYRWFGHEKRFQTANQFESWFNSTQLAVLRQRGFPSLSIEGAYDSGGSWTGRARVGTVQTYWSGRTPVTRGTFRVTLNRQRLGNASYSTGRDVAYWAGVIAHEMLHNLGHTHPVGRYNQLFIREYQNAIRYNAAESFNVRYLKLRNTGREQLTVSVRLLIKTARGWQWYPNGNSLTVRLAPGQTGYLNYGGRPVSAARALISARGSRGGTWRSRDLRLVRKSYRARSQGTFTYTFNPSRR